jgi:hypothetical protein
LQGKRKRGEYNEQEDKQRDELITDDVNETIDEMGIPNKTHAPLVYIYLVRLNTATRSC